MRRSTGSRGVDLMKRSTGLIFWNPLINPLKKSVNYKGLKSANYKEVNLQSFSADSKGVGQVRKVSDNTFPLSLREAAGDEAISSLHFPQSLRNSSIGHCEQSEAISPLKYETATSLHFVPFLAVTGSVGHCKGTLFLCPWQSRLLYSRGINDYA